MEKRKLALWKRTFEYVLPLNDFWKKSSAAQSFLIDHRYMPVKPRWHISVEAYWSYIFRTFSEAPQLHTIPQHIHMRCSLTIFLSDRSVNVDESARTDTRRCVCVAMKPWPRCSLPSSWRIVWCGRQCRAPMAFPAQLFHRPCSTQVAVMTEDARLVALHSLDTVAPIVAPSPARPLTKARICKPDICRFKIGKLSFNRLKKREIIWPQRGKLHCRHVFHCDDLQIGYCACVHGDEGWKVR